jgi:hypothetical protein
MYVAKSDGGGGAPPTCPNALFIPRALIEINTVQQSRAKVKD